MNTRRTVASGQALDVSLLFAPFPEALKTGNIVTSSATSLPGCAWLNAKSIISVDPEQGSVGGAALLALDKMGITGQLKPKIFPVR